MINGISLCPLFWEGEKIKTRIAANEKELTLNKKGDYMDKSLKNRYSLLDAQKLGLALLPPFYFAFNLVLYADSFFFLCPLLKTF